MSWEEERSNGGSSVTDNREFFLPHRKQLPARVSFRCPHCGESYSEEYAVEYCWPDRRRGPDRGLVLVCRACGCRTQLVLEAGGAVLVDDGKKNRAQKGHPRKRLRTLLLTTLSLLMTAFVLFAAITVGRMISLRSEDRDAGNAAVSDTSGQQQGDASGADKAAAALIQTDESGTEGNLFINISEGGLMELVDERVYYTSPSNEYQIYSMDRNFEDVRLECSIPAFYLNAVDGALVFSGADGGEKRLYRMDLDSGEVQQLSEQVTYEPKVKNGVIYYDDVEEEYSLYRCEMDGSDRRWISGGSVFYSCITDDTIYYLDTQDDYHLYSMDLNGGNKRLVYDQSSRELSLMDDCLYLSLREGGILKHEIGSGEMRWVSDVNAASLVAATDGWLYFANRDKEDRLYKMRQDGSELTKLSSEPAAFVNVAANLISYQNKDTKDFYWMLTDGSCRQQIQ